MLSKTVTKRLTHEVKTALAQRDKRGQSKHAAKQAARAEAQRMHTSYTQITGLYATSSFSTYQKQALTALRWIAEQYGCKRLDECRPYLSAYYAEMQARGLSAWTIRTRVYALCSVYDADYAALFGIERLPARHRADIKRGRQMSAADARHNTPEQQDVRTIARACGARRGGILALTAEDLIARDGCLYVHLREKGGKEREAIVLPQYGADARAGRDFFSSAARPHPDLHITAQICIIRYVCTVRYSLTYFNGANHGKTQAHSARRCISRLRRCARRPLRADEADDNGRPLPARRRRRHSRADRLSSLLGDAP